MGTATDKLIVIQEFKALIPPLSAEERAGLEADLLREGCTDTLKVWRTKDGDILLDGHNRLAFCKKHGIPYLVEAVPGIANRESAIRWMIAHQSHRRNLNEAQRAMLAGLLANLENGQHTSAAPIGAAHSQPEAAKLLNVSRRSVQRASKVQQHGIPELAQLVTAGQVSVSAAADVAALLEHEQRKLVVAGPEAVAETAREIRRCRQGVAKAEARIVRKPSQPSFPDSEDTAGVATLPQPSPPAGLQNSSVGEATALQQHPLAAPRNLLVSPEGLLPCAQCGSVAEFDEDFDLRHGPSYCLVCCNPGCCMQTPLRRDKEEARAIWNRRQIARAN